MTKTSRRTIAWTAVLASLAMLQQGIASRRPPPPELRVAAEFLVTSSGDDGTGSLREAIFSAATVPGRARIRLPAGRILVRTPLPPFVNGQGIVIEGIAGSTEIDASGMVGGAVFDVDAPGSILSGITFLNASAQAVLVRKNGVTVVDSGFIDCDQGLYGSEGIEGLTVERATFTRNRIGVWLAADRGRTEIRASRFLQHKDAAIWVVRAERVTRPTGDVSIAHNRFDEDRISLVLANASLLVEENTFTRARDVAILLLGKGAVVRRNRIQGGTGVGLIADGTDGVVIDSNEIDNNRAIGVLVRSSGDVVVRGNRLHANGYGLAFVLGRPKTPNLGDRNTILRHTYDGVIVIGDSPVLRENQVLNGSLVGLRILDFYSSQGTRTPADPLLQRNRVEGNAIDAAIRGEYRVPPKPGSPR